MIRLQVSLYPDGCLKSFEASGHAGLGVKGQDILCAAVSVLLRTCARLLSGQPDVWVSGDAPQRGIMRLSLQHPPAERSAWIKGITDFLLTGVLDLKREFPDRFMVEIEGKKTGVG